MTDAQKLALIICIPILVIAFVMFILEIIPDAKSEKEWAKVHAMILLSLESQQRFLRHRLEEKLKEEKTATTPEEFAEKMEQLKYKYYHSGGNPSGETYDDEEVYYEMCDLVCEVLRGCGYHKGADIFDKIPYPYS